ncbi:MAG: hypothetical protein GY940_24920, partial [bacterium]|nr:hypothetical protein [bacterium]
GIVFTFSLAGKDNHYPRRTTLFLSATDNSAGVAGIWYVLNGTDEKEYVKSLVFSESGEFSLTIRVEDNVGNEAIERIQFVVD